MVKNEILPTEDARPKNNQQEQTVLSFAGRRQGRGNKDSSETREVSSL